MRYAIISDIHSNIDALKIFFEVIKYKRINKVICLGDLVGYNPNPNECVRLLSRLKSFEVIRGNHDRTVIDGSYHNFTQNARIAIKWTIDELKSENMEYLKTLPAGPLLIDDDFYIAHGSLHHEDRYILSHHQAMDEVKWLIQRKVRLSFFGHTHYQIAYRYDDQSDTLTVIDDKVLTLDPECYYVINPGALGQPRDNDPRAAFAIYDSEKQTVEINRFDYPIEKVQRKIFANNLPEFLAQRLELGR